MIMSVDLKMKFEKYNTLQQFQRHHKKRGHSNFSALSANFFEEKRMFGVSYQKFKL